MAYTDHSLCLSGLLPQRQILRIWGKNNFAILDRVSAENNTPFCLVSLSISRQILLTQSHLCFSSLSLSHQPFPEPRAPTIPSPPSPFISLYLSIIDSDQCCYFIQRRRKRAELRYESLKRGRCKLQRIWCVCVCLCVWWGEVKAKLTSNGLN